MTPEILRFSQPHIIPDHASPAQSGHYVGTETLKSRPLQTLTLVLEQGKRHVDGFLDWCAVYQVPVVSAVAPLHVATWVESLGRDVSKPSVKQALAAVRHFFDFLVTGHIVEHNPTASVKGPKHSVRRGKTPVSIRPKRERYSMALMSHRRVSTGSVSRPWRSSFFSCPISRSKRSMRSRV